MDNNGAKSPGALAASVSGEDRQAAAAPLLELRGISKTYGRASALNDVSFHVGRGEILGLLGDNGAGKSTLVKTMSGVVQPDSGSILWDGEPVRLRSRQDSADVGIEVIYQDAGLVNSLSIARNIFLGREPCWPGGFMRLRHHAQDRRAGPRRDRRDPRHRQPGQACRQSVRRAEAGRGHRQGRSLQP